MAATGETTQEWARRLTPKDCMTLIYASLRGHDMKAVHTALHLLAVKDPDLAQRVLDAINLGIEFRRFEEEFGLAEGSKEGGDR